MQIQRHCRKNAACSQFYTGNQLPVSAQHADGAFYHGRMPWRANFHSAVDMRHHGVYLKVTDRMSLTSVIIHEKCRHTWIQDSRKRLRIAVPPLLGIFPQDLVILRFNFGFGDFSGKTWDFYCLWETYILRDVLKSTFVSLQWLSPICNPFLPLEWLDMSPLP